MNRSYLVEIAMDARQNSVALQARVDELEAAAEYALKELGFPTDNYPAPVVNAWLMLKAVLDRGRSGRGRALAALAQSPQPGGDHE